jgi:hypothetical protein
MTIIDASQGKKGLFSLEELIAEWLHLDGFLVEANLPVVVPAAGGRGEVGIVGPKVKTNVLELLHIETGQLARGKKSIRSVRRKFSGTVTASFMHYFRERFSNPGRRSPAGGCTSPRFGPARLATASRGMELSSSPSPCWQ